MGGGEETKTGEEQSTTQFDLNDYTIIKEGEAEILMHTKNEVFYNKTQVNNRDMSIAVLRTFISKRKEEHEALLSKRIKKVLNVSKNSDSGLLSPSESPITNGKSNGECEEMPHYEPCGTCEEPEKIPEGKGPTELKPPRVLEALSATGLRALRYAREVEGIGQVVALDNDKGEATKTWEEQSAAQFDLNDYTIIKEGEAEILMHTKNEVFYNKTHVNNRDMSIAVLRTFISKRKEEHEALLSKRIKKVLNVSKNSDSGLLSPSESPITNGKSNGECEEMPHYEPCGTCEEPEKIPEGKGPTELKPPRVLEALSATGLRALRYAREVEGIGQVVALDNDKASVEACRRNIKFNGSIASAKVESNLSDARVYMLTHPKEFDMVDLDPYGSPSVFLDSAVQSIADGGMLMCTATDMAVLCGGNGEVCYSKYGSYPLKAKYCHEMALRVLLACIESHANRYKRYIVPVLSVQMDFYVRVFVRIYTSAGAMKNTPLKLSYVYQCIGCDSFHLQPLARTVSKNTSVRYLPGFGPVVAKECNDCGKKYNLGGPIWSAPIHDQDWVTSILADVKSMKERYPAFNRISAVLTTISEELPDVPLFLSLHSLCATLKCTSPSAVVFRSAVINAGYHISGTHVNPLGLKSDAPMDVIWDIMRCWVKKYPVKAQSPEHSGSVILSKDAVLQANFARAVVSLSKAQAKKVARFLPNPERHWGPKLRAGRTITSKHASLLGPEKINEILNNNNEEECEEPEAKQSDFNL